MPRDDESLGDQRTYEGGVQPADSSDRSLGDQFTFGGGGESSLSDIGGLTGDADLDMEIVDLSRYEVQETLGKGGMGEVLLATDTRLNRKVAIKRMLGDASKSQTAVKRFLTEAQSIAALNHFNIVQIHDYGRDKDGPFLIMEYVGGGSLLDKCREGALPLEEAVELICQVCDGLSQAHDAGIIHRDIKPANVLLTSRGEPKLTDFGLARQGAGDTGQTMAGAVVGTLDFMPPEQRKDATTADHRSDLWSLAATLYQLVTGVPPRVIDLNDVPEDLRPCLAQALKQKPDDRYQSVSEFRDALRGFSSEVTFTAAFDPLSLAEGQCASCGTSNASDRNFCRDCGESLLSPCPDCSEPAAIWDNFCGHCGGDIRSRLETQLTEARELRDTLSSLRSTYQYSEAMNRLQPLMDASHPALDEFRNWSVETHEKLSTEYATLLEQRDQLAAAAREQLDQGKFSAAQKYIGQIPEPLHTEDIQSLADEITAKSDEVKQIGAVIQSAIKTRSYDGLLGQVEHYLTLKPGDATGQKLLDRLQKREQKQQDREAASEDEFDDYSEEKFDESDSELSTTRSASRRRQSGPRIRAANQLRLMVGGGVVLVLVVIGFLLSGDDDPSVLTTVSDSSDNDASIVSVESSATDDDSIASNDSTTTGDSGASPQVDSTGELTTTGYLTASTDKGPNAESTMSVDSSATGNESTATDASSVETSKLDGNAPAPAVAPFDTSQAKAHQKAWAEYLGVSVESTNSIGMKFVVIPPGEFTMGTDLFADQSPSHKVTLTQAFELGVHEVTQEQYEQVMDSNPSYFMGQQNPVEMVKWSDAVDFCQQLSDLPGEKSSGYVYRLPTEAEWEYSCRAGTTTIFSFGDYLTPLGEYAWFKSNSHRFPHPVGEKKQNAWGLYDMHGNVWEWCQDGYGKYASEATIDPKGPSTGSVRVVRGASWFNESYYTRYWASSARWQGASDYRTEKFGFRVVRFRKIEDAAASSPATDVLTLFDGTDLSSWAVDPDTSKAFTVNNRVLACSGDPSGVLWTKDDFRDFELSLEYRFPPGRLVSQQGSGVIVRTRDIQFRDLVEVQLEPSGDSDASGAIWLGREARLDTGRSSYSPLLRPRASAAVDRSIGQWNKMTIRCDGPNIVVILNDAIVNSGRNANEYAGPVGLRSQGTAIQFLNIKLRELNKDDSPETTASTSSATETSNEPPQPARKPVPARAVAFGNSHYLFSHSEMDWESARRHCESLDGHLPIVTSQEENDFLRDMLMRETAGGDGKEAIWLGASDARQEGNWKWIDGSPVTFNAWGPKQPNNKQQIEHYAVLWRGGQNPNAAGDWSDQPLKSIQHRVFCVCEWDNPPATASSAGWQNIFNGRDLTGWRGDTEFWSVDNGELIGKSSGRLSRNQFLILKEAQGDFELQCQFQLVGREGNSGIQIRSTDWGSQGVKGHQVDLAYGDFTWLGCLVGEGIGNARIEMTTDAQKSRLRQWVDQTGWNDLSIKADDQFIKIRVNEETTVSTLVSGIPKSGVIALQLHGGQAMEVRYRDIKLRRLTEAAAPVSSAVPAQGDNETELFNGKDLTGWTLTARVNQTVNAASDWTVADGVFRSLGKGENWLESEEQYDNFVLSFDWRLFFPGPNGSGVVVRCNGLNKLGFDPCGIEVDLRPRSSTDGEFGTGRLITYDTPLSRGTNLTPAIGHGHIPRTQPYVMKPAGQWNQCEIRCDGTSIEVTMDGRVVNKAFQSTVRAGHICLRNQKTVSEFRNLTLRPLTD